MEESGGRQEDAAPPWAPSEATAFRRFAAATASGRSQEATPSASGNGAASRVRWWTPAPRHERRGATPGGGRRRPPRRAHELKEEGNRLFRSRDYAGALRQYELALRLAPRGHPDRAVFHSNRAACLLQLRPVDHEAVAQECSLALQAEPRFPRALLRRARALEALGRHELALADALALLALDPDHRDAIDLSHRLRSRVNASAVASASSAPEPTSRPSPAALGEIKGTLDIFDARARL